MLRFAGKILMLVENYFPQHTRVAKETPFADVNRMNSGLMQIPKSFHDQGNISQALALPNRLQPSSLNT